MIMPIFGLASLSLLIQSRIDRFTNTDGDRQSAFRQGVSNSNQYEGRILTKMELAGRIKTKTFSAARKGGKKGLNITKAAIITFDDDAGRTNTSGGPRV